ncbi:MAG: KEOPS complex subunit Cgi121 [Candidatus Ranarchaeia archaeon]|jgi:tRNA threonylcarbamoyladenosine modification (KEOPS) complex Cgi121 subunit
MILETEGHWIGIFGAKVDHIHDVEGLVKSLSKIGAPYKSEIQLFNADLVATWEHLYFATIQAEAAFKNRTNLAKSIAMETILHASAQRQIEKALDNIGIHRDSNNIAILIIGKYKGDVLSIHPNVFRVLKALENPMSIDLTPSKIRDLKRFFKISPEEFRVSELAAPKLDPNQVLVNLIIDRCARLSLEKRVKQK